jgi:hypothetical protein
MSEKSKFLRERTSSRRRWKRGYTSRLPAAGKVFAGNAKLKLREER